MKRPDAISYQEAKEQQDRIGWPMIHFTTLDNMREAMYKGDKTGFINASEFLDITLAGFYDDDYYKDMLHFQEMQNGFNPPLTQEEQAQLSRIKSLAQSRLLFRVNQGEQRLTERVGDSEVIKEIAYKLHKGKGQNIIFTGKTGSGKSWASIKLAEEVGRLVGVKFDIKNVIFEPEELLKLIEDVKKVPPKTAIIFEEAGASVGRRNWHSHVNKAISQTFQIVRQRQLLVIMNTPDLGFLDSHVVKLAHFWFESEKLEENKGICYMKPHIPTTDQTTGKVLYPYPRFRGTGAVRQVWFTAPSKTLTDVYEARAEEWKNQEHKNILIDLKSKDPNNDPLYNKFKELREAGAKVKDAAQAIEVSGPTASKYNKRYITEKHT